MPKKRDHGQGGLYKIRGGRLWRGVIDLGFDADGKRVQKYVHAKTQRACAEKLDELRAEIRDHGAPLDKQVTVAAWADTWLETVAKVTVDPKTYSTYASLSRRWIVPTLGRKAVHSLKPSDVRAVRTAITDAGRSASTARQAHVVLSLMLDAAKAERITRANVAEDVRRPKGKKVERGAFTTEQALAVLRAAAELPNSSGSRWWFKLLGGPRQGEILGARLADLNLDAGYYAVERKLEELARDHGCGDEPCGRKRGADCTSPRWRVPDGFTHEHLVGRWHLTEPKSRTGRVVPLIPQLVEATRRHIDATADWPNPHGLIWRNPDGSPILPVQDAAEWRDLLQSVGIITAEENRPGGTPMTGHWARHTTVTILASLGVDFQLIGEIVGHSSAQVTAMYRHAQASEKAAAMAQIGTVWAEGLTLPQIES